MPDAFSSLGVAGILIVFLFGVILIGVGVFRTRAEYRREVSALKASIDQLRDQLQAVKK
jgi:predicted transporter